MTRHSIKQLSAEEWQPGNYLEYATIDRPVSEIVGDLPVVFEEYYEPGLGRCKSARLATAEGTSFVLISHLDTSIPITEIAILYNPTTSSRDLDRALKALGLSRLDVDHVASW
jgi:hypothetical protein